MGYESLMLTINNTFHRDKFEELYPDGVVPKSDVVNIMTVFINSIEGSVEDLEKRLGSGGPNFAVAIQILQPIRAKEFTELRENLEKDSRDVTIDEMEKLVDNTTDHLAKFVDFLYGPPQFDMDWFQAFLKKYRDDMPF